MIITRPGVAVRVLIIEDNNRYASELRRAFQQSEKGITFEARVVTSVSGAEPFIEADQTDIYLVDLEIPELNSAPDEKNGEMLVKKIIQRTNGGVIIHTGSLRKDSDDFLWGGVDDYIEKGDSISSVIARAFAVWRRIKAARGNNEPPSNQRSFRLGKWRFEPGNRNLVSDDGDSVRLSPTELAFVQYLCSVDREIDRREFNVAVLGRPPYEQDKRIDNLVYRLREKLGDSFQLVSNNEGVYRLVSFEPPG